MCCSFFGYQEKRKGEWCSLIHWTAKQHFPVKFRMCCLQLPSPTFPVNGDLKMPKWLTITFTWKLVIILFLSTLYVLFPLNISIYYFVNISACQSVSFNKRNKEQGICVYSYISKFICFHFGFWWFLEKLSWQWISFKDIRFCLDLYFICVFFCLLFYS